MSFDEAFRRRWEEVIGPAISLVRLSGIPLQPHRVDMRRVSDSILTEILAEISQCRLILADVTTMQKVDDKPIRNGNVMYEVGLAHAVRLPEEVLLFRSDNDPVLFDVANIRINKYDPDGNPLNARKQVTETILSVLREVELQKHMAVARAAAALDFSCWSVLTSTARGDPIQAPVVRTMGQALTAATTTNAISRLLDLGILTTEYTRVTPDKLAQIKDDPPEKLVYYQLTSFGEAVLDSIGDRIGFRSPEIQELMRQLDAEQSGKTSDEKKG
jgi:hypothetical protein